TLSNVFKAQRVLFFPVPQHLVTSGAVKALTGAALILYVFLCFEAQRRSRVSLELTNAYVREQAGLSPTAIRDGATQLWEAGLIDYCNAPGKPRLFVLLNPQTRQPADTIHKGCLERY